MCIYCEKGQRFRHENTIVHVDWKDCVPMIRVENENERCNVTKIMLKIMYCPWCGRDLIDD